MKQQLLFSLLAVMVMTAFKTAVNENHVEVVAVEYMMQFHNSSLQTIQPEYADEKANKSKEKLEQSTLAALLKNTGTSQADTYSRNGVHFLLTKPIVNQETASVSVTAYYPTGDPNTSFRWDKRILTLNKTDTKWKVTNEQRASGIFKTDD